MDSRPPDFFISRAGADAPLAAEIGRILEAEGHSVVLQQWDLANQNFMERMHAALESGARVIALLSDPYLASDHCAAEWQNAIAHDPLNKRGRLIVLRVAEATPTGLLTAIAYWDLVPVRGNPTLLRDIVLHAVQPPDRTADPVALRQYWQPPRPIVHPEIRHTSSFTGREAELAGLHALLRAGPAAITQPVAAHGLGGIGKSVLAREYAHLHQADYAGVWWLNAARPADGAGFEGVERGLVDLGALFIRGLDRVENRAAAARQTLDFIAHGGFEKRWLLVYDNVDDARVLTEWAPIGNAHVLMTTRIGGWPSAVGSVEITAWSPAEAKRYLRAESGRADLGEADADAVVDALGCLPLALSHAAAVLRARRNIKPADYLEGLARRMCEAPAGVAYPRAVFATFHDALEQAEAVAPGARTVMSLAAFFAPDDVPEELYHQPPQCYPPPLAEQTRDAIDEAIGALADLSLVQFSTTTRTFSIHRLVLAAARDALGSEVQDWSDNALMTMYWAFPQPEPASWPACERLATHARAVASHVTEDSRALAWLVGNLGVYLQERAALAKVLPLFERARDIFERLAASNPGNAGWQRDLSVLQERIGHVESVQGDLGAALASYRASLAIRERLAASDPGNADWQRDLSVSYNKIGDVQSAQGDLGAALASYRASWAIAERLAGADPGNAGWQRDLSVSHNNIGDVQSAQDDLGAALASYRTSFAIRERSGGSRSRQRWLAARSLGVAYQAR